MELYDYIIAGSGGAGLSLAFFLNNSVLKKKKVLILDKESKNDNDRTWCFWSKNNSPFQQLVHHQWSRLQFRDHSKSKTFDLKDLSYQLIRSSDFYRFIKEKIQCNPNFTWKQATISGIRSIGNKAVVTTNIGSFEGSIVFNSALNSTVKNTSFHYLLQHFKGWVIESPKEVFDSKCMTLMDFGIDQKDATRFMYVLPFSSTSALVEFTVFSKQLLPTSEYNSQLESYIRNRLGLNQYNITEEEFGVIPMTDQPFDTKMAPNVINIGTIGGAVKPTTGYAFTRFVERSKQIVDQLVDNQLISDPIRKARIDFYDTLLLSILTHEPQYASTIFTDLFMKNDIHAILKFLDEQSNWLNEAKLFSTLPKAPFFRAIYRTYLQKQKNGIEIPATI